MPRGGSGAGAGRKVGIPNKASVERQKKVSATGQTPLEYMLKVMRDGRASDQRRDDMAKAAAPYMQQSSRMRSTLAVVRSNQLDRSGAAALGLFTQLVQEMHRFDEQVSSLVLNTVSCHNACIRFQPNSARCLLAQFQSLAL